jgi:hypothetical protein
MANRDAALAYLLDETKELAAFDCIVVTPVGHLLEAIEIVRLEEGGLELRVPGRPAPFPNLTPDQRQALETRGFESEDPENPIEPWAKSAADAPACIDILQDVQANVFDAKPGVRLDITHGSHRLEHEARQKLAIVRERIEPIVETLLGRSAERDADGDYVLPIGQVHVTVAPRAGLDGAVVIRVFAVTNVGINVSPELGLFLARLNFGLMFGRFSLDVEHHSIWFDETLLGEHFREEELRFAIDVVSTTADAWDDRLKQMFGGVTYQEVLAGKAAEEPPTIKPGEGVGMYL